jgi:hypothetical protein
LLLGALIGGCSINEPPYLQTGPEELPDDTDVAAEPNQPASRPDAGTRVETDAGKVPSVIMEPVGGSCVDGATRACGPETVAGMCRLGTRACHDGAWSNTCDGAVMPAQRDCSSPLDNDCDGLPDNTVDDACLCVVSMNGGSAVGMDEPCNVHPGFDGNGPCIAGRRTCELSADRRTSDWGECVGGVGPVPQDSCTVRNDDSDCDGRPNGNCTCIEGEVIACGPSAAVGICKKGTSTCVNGRFSDCSGAVYPKQRDCSSPLDNDCSGAADNTLDGTCTCQVDKVQACGEHPEQDGNGACTAGTQTCKTPSATDHRSSAFTTCAGSVGPTARNCASLLDNDCDGLADNTTDTTCACAIGAEVACSAHTGLDGVGICKAGRALCIAGPSNSSSSLGACTGAVGPLAADSCTVQGDDSTCNGIANEGCQCIISASCPDATASRCTAGRCVACAAAADCAHIAGRSICSAGACVQCTSAANCAVGEVCDVATGSCAAAPVVIPPVVIPPIVIPPITL